MDSSPVSPNRPTPVSAVAAATPSGTGLPVAGTSRPMAAASGAPSATVAEVEAAAARLNLHLALNERELRFRVARANGRTVVTLVNTATGEVVRQIPSEEVMVLAQWLGESGSARVMRTVTT
ncbi:MAG TPA: flagellar protein FlaG [Steroidobacteraceae bacterium]|nr:flagellar protein FlaG [Steroidobacteraceae bacterium]